MYHTHFEPNTLSLRSGERARERGALNRLRPLWGSVYRDFPSPHSFVAGRGRGHCVESALFVFSSILPTAHQDQDRKTFRIHANPSWITSPCTSVSRRSVPLW